MLKLRWRRRMRNLSVGVVLALALAVPKADGREWSRVRPRIASEVRTLSRTDAISVLGNVCVDTIRHVERIGLTCSTRDLGRAFSDIVDGAFHPEGVVYGQFLSANSEDAVVSGWSAETHPDLWLPLVPVL